MSVSSRIRTLCFLLVAALQTVAFPAFSQAQIKLYLKDGSYQLVKSYQVEGDRVRFYSLDRSDWEEVPLSLVDFKATKAAETAKQQRQQKILQEAEKTTKDTYQLPPNTGTLIAPGLRLPQSEGLYAYDGTRVVALIQSRGSMARDKKRMALNMALPGPLLKTRSLVILPGPEAGVRLLNPDPTFYVQLPGAAGSTIQLLRLKARKNDRVMESLEARFKGTPTESRAAIPVERRQTAPGIYELQLAHPLTPGEYALGEIDHGKLNLDVWDFGIESLQPKVRK